MQELEKILEEIDQKKELCLEFNDEGYKAGALDMANVIKDIIRKHMNDGWIPVDERLPDNNEDVLVTTDMGLITFGYVTHGKWITDQEPDYPIAWRPYPEPYHPERSESKAMRELGKEIISGIEDGIHQGVRENERD